MFRSISNTFSTTNSTVSVVAAALVAGMVVFLMPAAPMAKAEVQATASLFAKADRLPVVAKDLACSLTNWPNYASNCQFDLRASSGETRTVRIIVLR